MIRFFDRRQDFRTNSRRIIARELVMLRPVHVDLAKRVSLARQTVRLKRGDCLTGPSPRACRARQTNHSNCSLNLIRFGAAYSPPTSEFTAKVTVSGAHFFKKMFNSFAFTSYSRAINFRLWVVCRRKSNDV